MSSLPAKADSPRFMGTRPRPFTVNFTESETGAPLLICDSTREKGYLLGAQAMIVPDRFSACDGKVTGVTEESCVIDIRDRPLFGRRTFN
jgi:hypothetical protein